MTPYEETLRWLYGLSARGIRYELERVRGGMAVRNHPERGLPFVHVTGTNGKGSTTAMVEAALRSAGHRTGMFTSPHLNRFTERIRIDGRELSKARVVAGIADIQKDEGRLPRLTFFEHACLLALEEFHRRDVDIAVLEVGLGGRLDATNVIDPEVSIITSIAVEHRRILGFTRAAIAKEKAGIIKRGKPVIVGVRGGDARKPIRERARRMQSPALLIDRDFGATSSATGRQRVDLFCGDAKLEGVRLGLLGSHQVDNAACAYAALLTLRERGFAIDDEAIRRGLGRVKWPGRLEHVRGAPSFLFDCAHNRPGAEKLAEHLDQLPRRGRRVLLFAALKDKDHEGILGALDDRFDKRVYASPALRRAVPASTFTAIRPGSVARSVREGVARAKRMAGDDGLVVVAGSLFLVAAARQVVLGVETDPPIGM